MGELQSLLLLQPERSVRLEKPSFTSQMITYLHLVNKPLGFRTVNYKVLDQIWRVLNKADF